MTDLVQAARQLAEHLTDSLDCAEEISYLQVLDALGLCRLTLTEDAKSASRAFIESVEREGIWAES